MKIVIPFLILLFCYSICYSQEVLEDSLQKSQERIDTIDCYDNIRDLLFINKALKMAKRDSIGLFNHYDQFYLDEGGNKFGLTNRFMYEKIDVSNRKTLDYKKLSEQYPKRGQWESVGLLLFEIVTKSYIDSKINTYPGH